MKKLLIIAAVSFFSISARAQNLNNFLKKAADAVGTVVSAAENSVNLVGSWDYVAPAVGLKSDNVLNDIAATAVTSAAEEKVDEYFRKIGIIPGSISVTFNTDNTFSWVILGRTLEGTWSLADGVLKMRFGKVMQYLSMTGVARNSTKGVELLFESDNAMKFIQSLLKLAAKKNDTASLIRNLSENYEKVQIGFEFTKK